MKTDRFSDSIRRKLESIRPDFSEKDWKRMQATLQQATPPPSDATPVSQPFTGSAWSAQPWLMAAAAVSTVVLVSLAIYQRNQITHLRQTVRQLSGQQTARSRPTTAEPAAPNAVALSPHRPNQRGETRPGPLQPSADRSEPAARQPDTVYVTRYVAVPGPPARPATAQRAPDAPSSDRPDRTRSVANVPPQQPDRSATPDRNHDVADGASPRADGPANGLPNVLDNRPGTTNPPIRPADERLARPSKSQLADNASGRKKRRSPADATETAAAPPDGTTTSDKNVTAAPAPPVTGDASGEVGQRVATYALTASRPLTLNVIDWSNALARQAKRMRPVRTTTVGGQEASVSQPASQPVRVAFGFRVGVGGEVSRTVRSGSLQTELLIGKHLTLGVGLGMGSFAGGTFLTPEKFDERKEKEHKPGGFKREYVLPRRIDPRSDITNIGIHTTRMQIPISLGYRIPVSQTLSLLPSVGTTLGMRSKEFVTFTYREPFRSYEAASQHYDRPVDLFNNLTFGANVEWHRNHWVGQAGPLLTVPTVADANWQQNAAVALRARVFYQF